jgi:hypothetical protein
MARRRERHDRKTGAPRKPEMKNYALPKEDVDALVSYMTTLNKK